MLLKLAEEWFGKTSRDAAFPLSHNQACQAICLHLFQQVFCLGAQKMVVAQNFF